MKKKFRSLLAVFATATLLVSATTAPASAATNTIKVERGGVSVKMDQAPFLHDNRTFVPLRAIFQDIGATINWDAATQKITATKGDVTVELTIGSSVAYRNGAEVLLDAPAMIRGGSTFVPVRFIAESFNTPVRWDGATQTVRLLESNRARLEEVLKGTSEQIHAAHINGSLDVKIKSEGARDENIKAKYDLDFDYNQGEDLLNLHAFVKPSGELALFIDKLELYIKNNQLYYYDPMERNWFTAPLPEQPAPAEGEAAVTPANIKAIAKYATLDEQDTQDVITFYLGEKGLQEFSQNTEALPPELKNMSMKMTLKLDKKTHTVKEFDLDMGMKIDDKNSFNLHFDADVSKINEPVTITLPEEVKKAKTAESLPL